MTEKRAKLSRRNFLLTVGAGGAAATAAAVMKRPAESTQKTDDKRATAGYQASEHVSNYYRTTKV